MRNSQSSEMSVPYFEHLAGLVQAGNNFLDAFFGAETHKQWKQMKQGLQFHTDAEFAQWLLRTAHESMTEQKTTKRKRKLHKNSQGAEEEVVREEQNKGVTVKTENTANRLQENPRATASSVPATPTSENHSSMQQTQPPPHTASMSSSTTSASAQQSQLYSHQQQQHQQQQQQQLY